jgi:hypothetical protein
MQAPKSPPGNRFRAFKQQAISETIPAWRRSSIQTLKPGEPPDHGGRDRNSKLKLGVCGKPIEHWMEA